MEAKLKVANNKAKIELEFSFDEVERFKKSLEQDQDVQVIDAPRLLKNYLKAHCSDMEYVASNDWEGTGSGVTDLIEDEEELMKCIK